MVPAPSSQAMVLHDPSLSNGEDAETIDLREYWRILVKRKLLIGGVLTVFLIIAFISTLLAVPMYRASALIQIQEGNTRLVQYDNLGGDGPMWRDNPSFYSTQLQILRSTSVSSAVVDALSIAAHPDLTGERRQRSLMGEISSLLRSLASGPSARTSGPEDDANEALARAQARAAGALRSRTSAEQVRDSRLVRVSFDSFDRAFAVDVVNELVRQYSRLDLERRAGSGSEARKYLQGQIDEMRVALDQSDQALLEFSRSHGIASFGDTLGQVSESVKALNTQLREVQLEKVRLDALRDQVDAGQSVHSLELISENPTIRDLRSQLADAQAEYASLSDRFREGYPALVELRSRMDALRASITQESRRITDGIIARHENLLAQERALQREINTREQALLTLNQQAVEYNVLQRDFQTNRELYDGLLQRLKEVGVAEGVQRETVAVVEPARGAGQVYPNTPRTLMMALMLGLAAGAGLALLLEFLDNTVKSPDDIERLSQRPVLGLIPLVKVKGEVIRGRLKQPERQVGHFSARHPRSEVSEAFRSLRTSLMFSSPGGMPKILLLTSPAPGDGKTTCAINLATVLAQNGNRVLLIDADLRKPRIHKDFSRASSPGLTNKLTHDPKKKRPNGTISGTDVPGLFLMTAGTLPPNPAEMLGSERMGTLLRSFATVFDSVVIDSAPIIGLADALVLSRFVDGVVLVTAAGVTGKDNARMSIKRLNQVNAPLLGVVLNAVDMASPDYAYYSSYYYNYASDEGESSVRSLPKSA